MGSCFSHGSSPKIKNIIRVVHLSGYVEDFDYPVSVSQVITGQSASEHFVCTATLLLSPSSKPVLNPETQLQPGQVYFLLPFSALQSEVSHLDIAALVRKLTSIAKSNRCGQAKSANNKTTSLPMCDSPFHPLQVSIEGLMAVGRGNLYWIPLERSRLIGANRDYKINEFRKKIERSNLKYDVLNFIYAKVLKFSKILVLMSSDVAN